MAIALLSLPGAPVAWTMSEATRRIWRLCGGPREEVGRIFASLESLDLIVLRDERVSRSPAGGRLARTISADDVRPLGLALIRAGCFHDQARLLLEAASLNSEGFLICPRHLGRTTAPQLIGLLSLWEDVRAQSSISIPPSLVLEIRAVWALVPPEAELPPWVKRKKKIGNRAERYSFEYERNLARDPMDIKWVALDSDSLGFDIEDTTNSPSRAIEVKGRGNTELVFFLSDREWAVAKERGESYELQFWGGIDLSRSLPLEYAALRAEGYPVCISNVSEALEQPEWKMTPVKWRVEHEPAGRPMTY